MRADQPKNIHVKEKEAYQGDLFNGNRRMQRGTSYSSLEPISIKELLSKLIRGLGRLFVALKYQFFRLTAGVMPSANIPWFKLGLAAVVLFVLTKKDVQFSFNMKAPLAYITDDSEESTEQDRMSIVQPIVLKEPTGKKHQAASAE